MSHTLLEWACRRCALRISGPGESEKSIAWMALWHVERVHVGGELSDLVFR